MSLLELWARLRSMRIFLQMSRRALAMVRAATWHLKLYPDECPVWMFYIMERNHFIDLNMIPV